MKLLAYGAWLGLALATAAVGCSSPASLTQIAVTVESDMRVPSELDRLTISITGLTTDQSSAADLRQKGFPRKLTLVHDGGPLGPITVTASGWLGSSKVVERSMSVSFVKNATTPLLLRLDRAQVGSSADGGTLGDGGTDASVATRDAGKIGAVTDSGVVDAATGVVDSGPIDAGTGVVDSGPVDSGTDSAPPNQPPTCTITSPTNNQALNTGVSVTLQGSCTDPESGAVTTGLQWTSNIAGALGGGASRMVTSLAVGSHTLTLCAPDPNDATLQGCTSVVVFVRLPTPPTASITSVTQNGSSTAPFASNRAVDLVGTATGQSVTVSWVDSFTGSFSTTLTPSLSAPLVGRHRVTLTVTDNTGQSATAFVTFVVLAQGSGSQLVAPFASVNSTISSASVAAVAGDSANQVLISNPSPAVYRFDGGHATSTASVAIDNSKLPAEVRSLLISESNSLVFVGTGNGLVACAYAAGASIDATTCKTFRGSNLPDNQVNAIARVSGGGFTSDVLLLGTKKGVLVASDPAGSSSGTVVLSNQDIAGIAVSGQTTWIASHDSGLNRYIPAFGFPTNVNSGGPSDNATAVAVSSSGIVWVGSDSGIGRYEPFQSRWTVWQQGDAPAPGLVSDNVHAIAISRPTISSQPRDVIWIATNMGVSRFDPTIPSFMTLTTADGLPSNNVLSVAVLQNGSKVFGTTAGVALYTGP
jgi:hypothetical protein